MSGDSEKSPHPVHLTQTGPRRWSLVSTSVCGIIGLMKRSFLSVGGQLRLTTSTA